MNPTAFDDLGIPEDFDERYRAWGEKHLKTVKTPFAYMKALADSGFSPAEIAAASYAQGFQHGLELAGSIPPPSNPAEMAYA